MYSLIDAGNGRDGVRLGLPQIRAPVARKTSFDEPFGRRRDVSDRGMTDEGLEEAHDLGSFVGQGSELGSGELVAETLVDAAPAKGDVRVGLPGQVEVVGALDAGVVAVGGGVQHDQLVALGDLLTPEVDVA